MSEVWLPVKGYEGKYEVSSEGRVRSLDRVVKDARRGRNLNRKSHMLRPGETRCGYLSVVLCDNTNRRSERVHRLVAEAFLTKVDGKNEINHINGDKADNRSDNLEWVDRKENMAHAFSNGLHPNPAKTCYCDDGASYESTTAASKATGIRLGNISACCLGKRKTAGGRRWSYAPFEENAI